MQQLKGGGQILRGRQFTFYMRGVVCVLMMFGLKAAQSQNTHIASNLMDSGSDALAFHSNVIDHANGVLSKPQLNEADAPKIKRLYAEGKFDQTTIELSDGTEIILRKDRLDFRSDASGAQEAFFLMFPSREIHGELKYGKELVKRKVPVPSQAMGKVLGISELTMIEYDKVSYSAISQDLGLDILVDDQEVKLNFIPTGRRAPSNVDLRIWGEAPKLQERILSKSNARGATERAARINRVDEQGKAVFRVSAVNPGSDFSLTIKQ